MKDVEEIIGAFEHFVSQKGEGVILYSADGSIVKLQDIVDLVRALQRENEHLNDMEFTQEHCNLYEENEFLKDVLAQYMNGELVNEDVFTQQVKDLQQAVKYTARKIQDEAIEEASAIFKGELIISINKLEEICNKISEGK